jgi:hypothetical protein
VREQPMTEAEWDRCTDPAAMLQALCESGKASDRKLRLFAVTCCLVMWDLFTDGRSRLAVEVAEWRAEGRASDYQLREAEEAARAAYVQALTHGKQGVEREAALAALQTTYAAPAAAKGAAAVAQRTRAEAVRARARRCSGLAKRQLTAQAAERKSQCSLLRDIFGDPFRPLPSIDPAWLVWDGGTVPKLAQAIYDERAFERVPVLGDALEEAGCDSEDILLHCRQQGKAHVRVCWVLDLILEKE